MSLQFWKVIIISLVAPFPNFVRYQIRDLCDFVLLLWLYLSLPVPPSRFLLISNRQFYLLYWFSGQTCSEPSWSGQVAPKGRELGVSMFSRSKSEWRRSRRNCRKNLHTLQQKQNERERERLSYKERELQKGTFHCRYTLKNSKMIRLL